MTEIHAQLCAENYVFLGSISYCEKRNIWSVVFQHSSRSSMLANIRCSAVLNLPASFSMSLPMINLSHHWCAQLRTLEDLKVRTFRPQNTSATFPPATETLTASERRGQLFNFLLKRQRTPTKSQQIRESFHQNLPSVLLVKIDRFLNFLFLSFNHYFPSDLRLSLTSKFSCCRPGSPKYGLRAKSGPRSYFLSGRKDILPILKNEYIYETLVDLVEM